MANVRNNNTWFVDTASSASDATTFVSEKNLKLIGVLVYSNSSADELAIFDKNVSGNSAGAQKLSIMNSNAKDTKQLRLESCPIVFPNGVWISISSGMKATLIFTQGSNS